MTDPNSTTTVRVNGGEEMPLDDLTPGLLAHELGWDQDQLIPETAEEKMARVRSRLVRNVQDAQLAVEKAEAKVVAARYEGQSEEELLRAFDTAILEVAS